MANTKLLKITFNLFVLTVVLLLPACDRTKVNSNQDAVSLPEAFSDSASTNYSRAFREHKFNFPRDHAAHPNFRQEWW